MDAARKIEGTFVVRGYDEMVRAWVSRELGREVGDDNYRAFGILRDGVMVGGIIYHEYKGYMVEISFATTTPKWCTKSVVKELLSYPFTELGCVRAHVTVSKKNKQVRDFLKRLGFKQEGCHRKAFDGVNDAISYSLLKEENRWLDE